MLINHEVRINEKTKINIYGIDLFANYGVQSIIEKILLHTSETVKINFEEDMPDLWVMCNSYLTDIVFFLKNQREKRSVIIIGTKKHQQILTPILGGDMCFIDNTYSTEHIKNNLGSLLFSSQHKIKYHGLCKDKVVSLITRYESRIVLSILKGSKTSTISKMNKLSVKRISYYKRRLMNRLGLNTTQELYLIMESCERQKIINLMNGNPVHWNKLVMK